MHAQQTADPIYGLMAEFDDPQSLVAAAHQVRQAGYTATDAYSPFPIEELHEVLGKPNTKLPLLVLLGGFLGGMGGYALEYWVSAIAYPVNIGGKPFHSWPAFIPVTFECTVLGAALTCVIGMFALNRLPMPYHPVFNVERFAHASRNKFFLCIEASDAKFDLIETRRFLESLKPTEVSTVAE